MTVYQSKGKKIVVFPSTDQPTVTIADNGEKIHENYNDTKYGVIVVDQMTRKYTVVSTSSKGWPIYVFVP